MFADSTKALPPLRQPLQALVPIAVAQHKATMFPEVRSACTLDQLLKLRRRQQIWTNVPSRLRRAKLHTYRAWAG
jgi:hypothetical protein